MDPERLKLILQIVSILSPLATGGLIGWFYLWFRSRFPERSEVVTPTMLDAQLKQFGEGRDKVLEHVSFGVNERIDREVLRVWSEGKRDVDAVRLHQAECGANVEKALAETKDARHAAKNAIHAAELLAVRVDGLERELVGKVDALKDVVMAKLEALENLIRGGK